MQRLVVPQGEFDLARYPDDGDVTLRAWDAADELLLEYVAEHDLLRPSSGGGLVILNDGFGALSTALAAHRPMMLSDSYLQQRATVSNLGRNGQPAVEFGSALDPVGRRVDVLLGKVPRTLALLEDQLHRLRDGLHPGSVVVTAGMTKNVHTSTLRLFEQLVGPTTTSLARRKARLIFSTVAAELSPGASPWPQRYAVGDLQVVSHANVFSAGHLDIGTALLLEAFRRPTGQATVVDLGCGNGILGVSAALAAPEAELVFIDESYRAVASAAETFAANLGPDRPARFEVGDCFDQTGLDGAGAQIETSSVDLVLANPPFHLSHARSDSTSWRMFVGARRVLRPGGELWVVGNRHLGYHAKLKRIFGNCEVAKSNSKFVVLRAGRH